MTPVSTTQHKKPENSLPQNPTGTMAVDISSGQRDFRHARFRLSHVSRSAATIMYGDVCKETCKSPTPTTCKLECHSGAPFLDLQEDVPDAMH
jgi:hypothetical protein